MKECRWIFLNEKLSKESIEQMAQEINLPEMLSVILLNRGISKEKHRDFFAKSIKNIHHPFLLKDMQKSCDRIVAALNKKEKIVIYGDYDVDGITSTAILYDFLLSQNADVSFYIPDRADEGYGINIVALQKLRKAGNSLMITVDCGITAVGEIEFAKTIGLDIIVTDHHMCKEKIPKAYGVINPKQPDCSYPFKELAGVGVSFKLVLALAITLGFNTKEIFDKYIEFCSIGTIADVVPLIDENRIFVNRGINLMQNTAHTGIRALLTVSGAIDKPVNSSTVSFALAPRLNAAGRIGDVKISIELLVSKDKEEAFRLATSLNEENRNRRLTEQAIVDEARKMISEENNMEDKNVIILAKEGWHHGVIGIVSSRIVDKSYKPAIMFSIENGIAKGSGRSIKGVNLFEALSSCEDILMKFGGHELAAGLTLKEENLEALSTRLEAYVKEHLSDEDKTAFIEIDCEIMPHEITVSSAKMLELLEPFGCGNKKPVFASFGNEIIDIRPMGEDNRHVRLRLRKMGGFFDAVGFSMGELATKYKIGDKVDVAFNLDINNYRGEEYLQLVIRDIK